MPKATKTTKTNSASKSRARVWKGKRPATSTRKAAQATTNPAPRKQAAQQPKKATATRKQPNTEAAAVKAAAALDGASQKVLDGSADVSMIITDFDELLRRATEAMGDFANERKGSAEEVKRIVKANAGPGRRFLIHPLDITVVPDSVNSRDFATYPMQKRVRDLMYNIRAEGQKASLRVFIEDDLVKVWAGETRVRAMLHEWVLFGAGKKTIHVQLEEHGVNATERLYNAMLDGDTKVWSPIDFGRHILKLVHEGETPEAIAVKSGKTGDGSPAEKAAGVAWVKRHIGYMELPGLVQKLIANEMLSATTASQVFEKDCKRNSKKMLEVTEIAEAQRKLTNAGHIMPKHFTSALRIWEAEQRPKDGQEQPGTEAPAAAAPQVTQAKAHSAPASQPVSATESRTDGAAVDGTAADQQAVVTSPPNRVTGADAVAAKVARRAERTMTLLQEAMPIRQPDGSVTLVFSATQYAELAKLNDLSTPQADDGTGSAAETGEGVMDAPRVPHGQPAAVHAD